MVTGTKWKITEILENSKKKQKKTNKQREKEKKIGIKLKTVKISQTMLKLGIIVLQSISHPSEFCFTISSYCTKLNLLE